MSDTSPVALAKVEPEIVDVRRKLEDPTHLQKIKDIYCPGADDVEFALCIQTAMHLGFDPFAREIYFIPMWDPKLRREKFMPVVAIDGLRLAAERTGLYGGQTEPQWCGPDGKWVDVWLGDGPPAAAKVGVYRRDWERPLYCVVRYKSFVKAGKDGKPRAQWATMPDHMLLKCCEAQCLRKAFSRQLSGEYEVKDAEPNEQSLGFRVREDPQDIIKQLAEAPDRDALDELAAKAGQLPDEHKDAAREAWATARARVDDQARNAVKSKSKAAAQARRKSKQKPAEPEPAPAVSAHDYGPDAMTQAELAAVEASAAETAGFGFGEETDGD